MKRSTLNFIINAIMFICMAAITGIGFILKYNLIHGSERWKVYGDNVELFLFGIDRHQWGNIHLILGISLLALLALHIILHWKLVTCVYNRLFQKKLLYKVLTILFVIICFLFMLCPFIMKPTIGEIQHRGGKHTEQINQKTKEDNHISKSYNQETKSNKKSHKDHVNSDSSVQIRGFMTLDEVSEKYNIPTEELMKKLGIPTSVSSKQRLSLLKKEYHFEMSKIEKIIVDYQKNEK